LKWVLPLLGAALIVTSAAVADDLDDGISKQTDDAVSGYDELGSKDRNIKFIKMNAKSQAKVRSNKDGQVAGASGGANMNSVVMGPGSNIKGDIIIIDESKGPKTIVAD
jgi:hypothetical protein